MSGSDSQDCTAAVSWGLHVFRDLGPLSAILRHAEDGPTGKIQTVLSSKPQFLLQDE